MKGREVIVKSLVSEGVKVCFGIPGGQVLDLYDELYVQSDKIRNILVRHEQVAAHAAEGYAKASGKTGVCIATSGPGATNLVTGIADAMLDSVPIVALTGNVLCHLIGGDAFQETDIVGITLPITKHNYQITSIESIPKIFKEAFTIAASRRPGPVLIDIPKDMQQKELKGTFEYPKKVTMRGYNPEVGGGHPIQIQQAVDLLMNAERPVILAGGGVTIANAAPELTELALSLNIPVITTLMGKGVFPENHPLALGMAGMHGHKASNYAIMECDVLFAIGNRFDDRVAMDIKSFAPNAKIIHADIDSAELGKNVRFDIPIVGDAKLILKAMVKAVGKRKKDGGTLWHKHMEELKKEGADADSNVKYDQTPIAPERVMKELQKLIDTMGDGLIYTTEVGQNQMWAAHYLRFPNPRMLLTSGGLGTMGSGFPFAIGAKTAKPDKFVLDIAGDGSFQMTMQDLVTTVKEDLPVTVLILNNGHLGMVRQWQDIFYGHRYSGTVLGDSPDFIKIADAYKANGIRVDKPGDIAPALKQAVKSDVTTIIDVHIDPYAHIVPMVKPGSRIDQMLSSISRPGD
ncbi:3D-(3,5/4)-trihydroxycyclohexane-1,2-dione hydrolase [uncultured archaeon]|nr:3D-(3,5/4)-trihydroxycyclohexane-1,2-dione hydrolase [uncultured archaeon]